LKPRAIALQLGESPKLDRNGDYWAVFQKMSPAGFLRHAVK